MKRLLACAAVAIALGSASQIASAQYSGTQTGYVQCIIHYGDRQDITEITPVTRISMPKASGSTGKNIQFTLSARFQQYLLKQGKKFYQSACLENDDAEQLLKRAKSWEASKGYGNREKKEINPQQFWPAFLDYVHNWLAAGNPGMSRSAFAYSVDGSIEAAAN